MALDFLGTVFRHKADNQTTNYRCDDDPRTQMVQPDARKIHCELVVEEEVCEEPNQIIKNIGDPAGQYPDRSGQQRDQ